MSRYATSDPNLIGSILIREKLHLWLPLQLPRRNEFPKEFLLR
jgi:hypothetical protein